jgi:hypothetical protein
MPGFQCAVKYMKPDGDAFVEVEEFCPDNHATMNEAWDCTFFHFMKLGKVWLAENGRIIDGPLMTASHKHLGAPAEQ